MYEFVFGSLFFVTTDERLVDPEACDFDGVPAVFYACITGSDCLERVYFRITTIHQTSSLLTSIGTPL